MPLINSSPLLVNGSRQPYPLGCLPTYWPKVSLRVSGLDLGVAGAPETFLVDAQGIIRLRIQGEVNDRVFVNKIQPILETL